VERSISRLWKGRTDYHDIFRLLPQYSLNKRNLNQYEKGIAMKYLCFVITLILISFYNIMGQDITVQSENNDIIFEVRFYANRMEMFPFQWIAYVGARSGNYIDTELMTERSSKFFYQFADMARKATDEDRKRCIDSFEDFTSSKEKVLVLLLLHFSRDKKYLPFILGQVGNNEKVTWISDYDNTRKQVLADEKIFIEKMAEKIKQNEPLSYHEETRYRFISSKNMASGIGPNLNFSVQNMQTIGDYAKAILELWGIDFFKVQPSEFTEEFWKTYNEKNLMGRMYRLKYLVHVEATSPENCVLREREFINFLIENEPPLSAIIALFQIYSITIRAGVNNEVSFEILLSNYPDFKIPYQKVPKDDVWKLLTCSKLPDVDDEISFELSGGLTMFMLISGFLKHYQHWFNENEMNQHFDELNPITKQLWGQYQKHN